MKLPIVLLIFGLGLSASSQSVSSDKPYFNSFRQGQKYWSYLIEAIPRGNNVWNVKIKTTFDPDRFGPHYHQTKIDCDKQLIYDLDGNRPRRVPKEWGDTSELGLPELYEAVCEKKPE